MPGRTADGPKTTKALKAQIPMGKTQLRALVTGVCAFGLGAILVQAAAPPSPQGFITAKAFLNIGGGTAVTDLTGNAKFPNNPDIVAYPGYFEYPFSGDINTPPPGDVYNNYGTQIIGYFYPPATGDYVFYLAADDGSNLYLSTDADPANKKLIAQETGWSPVRAFTTIGGGSTVEAKNSQTFTGTEWPTKDPANGGARITLQANRAYYIEALSKEGGGGDNLAVAVQDPNFVIDASLPIPGQYLSTIDKTSGPVKIATQPQSQTVNEGSPVTFSVVADGTPPYTYQWKRNGGDIPNATGTSYTLSRAYRADNGAKFSVVVTGGQGTVTSAEATLTVNNDTTGPTLVSVGVSASFNTLRVAFSEPLDPATAQATGNYQISGGVTVSAAALGAPAGQAGDNVVVLTTSTQAEGATLTLTVNNVKDVPGNAIAANSSITFLTPVFARGWASYERWHNENGDPGDINAFAQAIADGTIRAPDFASAYQQFGGPWGARDNYSARVYGYFIPPANGNYVFFVASDDQSNVYLSTDDKPANKKLIAQETGWSNQYQWQTVGSGDATSKRSDQFGGIEWPTFNTITLTANRRYYMEVLWDEGGGGDGADVTFIREGDADPAQNASGMFMRGNVIATFLDPNGANVDITEQPADATQQEERVATFSVVATGTSSYGNTVTYQWQKAPPGSATFTDIPGANGASYTTPILTLADNGSKFQVVCSVPTFSKVSAAATLTVVPDTFPPKLVGAGSLMKGNAIEIGVGFDENVDPTTAGAVANYSLSKGTVTGVRYQRFAHTDGAGFFKLGTAGPFNGAAVVLTTSGLAAGDTVTVTAKNIKDVKGNTMPAAGESKALKVTSKMKWAAMGGNDYLEGETCGQDITTDAALWPDDAIALSEADFDLVSSGSANWNNYDEATFVYEEITGDFDKVVRVEYHDPTSQWARAGMCATPAHDEGVNRAAVAGGALMEKRYMLRANPAVQWNGTAGNNQNEADWRDTAGGNYGGTGAGVPAYPNAWLRMQRIGQTFTGFYSSDGRNWTSYGSHTFTAAEPMPDTLLVGIYYSPEMCNNGTAAGVGHSSVAKFRQYGSYVSNPSVVDYGIGLNFGADEPAGANGGILPSIGTAGVPKVLQANWNNLSGASGTSSAIVADSKGAAQVTAVQVEWSSPNTWSSTGRGEENNQFTGNDKTLMTGYLDTGAATTTTVTITGLPTELTSEGYDVYVYLLGGVPNKGGGYRIVSAATQAVLKDYVHAFCSVNPTSYVEVTGDPTLYNVGNYIVFKGLNAPGIVVEASTAGGHGAGSNPRAPLNAVQLVKAGGGGQEPGEMTISLSGGNVTINWEGEGTLQSATSVLGPWTNVGSTKPYTTPASAAAMYFRVQGQ